ARLVYMKSLALLPRQDEKEELEKELTGQLVEYHLCKQAASRLRDMSEGISFYVREPMELDFDNDYSFSHEARVLLESYLGIMGRGVRLSEPDLGDFEPLVTAPIVSVASRIVSVLRNLRISHVMKIGDFFKNSRSRSEAVATFLGILELIKAKRIEVNDSGDVTAIDRKRDTVV
ncbi:MAG: segregation/condensation protein A, partial [Oscillospiraceae bacterium]